MKKAREVIFPEGRPLTWDEYEDFKNHAINSSLWYATTYFSNSSQIREKLYKKGYPRNSITYLNKDGSQNTENIVEAVITHLQDISVLNDKHYAESFVESKKNQGVGRNKIFFELKRKGIPEEIISSVLENFQNNDDALDKAISRVTSSSSYKKITEPWKRRQKLSQTLYSKGFSWDDISDKLEDFDEWG